MLSLNYNRVHNNEAHGSDTNLGETQFEKNPIESEFHEKFSQVQNEIQGLETIHEEIKHGFDNAQQKIRRINTNMKWLEDRLNQMIIENNDELNEAARELEKIPTFCDCCFGITRPKKSSEE